MEEHESYNSIDLTEDEDSSGTISGNESPFNFVDCSQFLNEPQYVDASPPHLLRSSVVSSTSEHPKQKNTLKDLPKVPGQLSLNNGPQIASVKKVGQFTSVQIKPPMITQIIGDTTHEIETVYLDSDNETESTNFLPNPPPLHYISRTKPDSLNQSSAVNPQNNVFYSMKQPPGKVVVIKKNNKYYKIIIPHNVMPSINQSTGPVLINIPEVGPLVISNDPQAANPVPGPVASKQLSLNLDAAEQRQESRQKTRNVKTPKEQTLSDKKFCWTFNTLRKRDLEGFSAWDRLGFNKSELVKARKCERMLNTILTKCEQKLVDTTWEYEKFKKSLQKNKVKLVKINTIMRAKDKPTKKKMKIDTPFEKGGISSTESTINNVEDYGSDLLVTKKVMILNKKNKEVRLEGAAKETLLRKIGLVKRKSVKEAPKMRSTNLKRSKDLKIKPCYVEILKDKRVERAYARYCTDMGLDKQPDVHKRTNRKPVATKPAENKPPKVESLENLASKKSNIFDTMQEILKSRIIKSQDELEEEINKHKPILILTEQSVATRDHIEFYYNEFCKNNIIYVPSCSYTFPINVLKNDGFISAVEIGYVKLVDRNLFSKYVVNGLSSLSENYHNEHSYCYTKK